MTSGPSKATAVELAVFYAGDARFLADRDPRVRHCEVVEQAGEVIWPEVPYRHLTALRCYEHGCRATTPG